jgi:hypothetical protein
MPLPAIPQLDEILSKINLYCQSGKTIVGVYVNVGGKPIQGVNLKLYLGSGVPFGDLIEIKGKYTNYAGVIGYCITNQQYAEAWIQKPGMAFGSSSKGGWHKLGAVTGAQRGLLVPKPHIFNYIGALEIPSVCTAWDTVANLTIPEMLRPDIPFPINITGAKWECPSLNTSKPVSNVEAALKIAGRNYNFLLIGGAGSINLEDAISNIPSFITQTLAGGLSKIDIEVLIPNKDSGYTAFTRSVSLPSTDIISDICTAWETVATPTVPTTLSSSFPISVSGAKWVCGGASEFIDGTGKIEIDGKTFDLPLQKGYGRVNLGDLIDFESFKGLSTVPTTTPIVPAVTIIPPGISPQGPGATTITLYLNDYLRRKIYTPIRGAYWGAGYFDRGKSYTIHKATDASGTGDKYGVPCGLNVPNTHRYFGDYTVTVMSVQNLGLENASYTVKIEL